MKIEITLLSSAPRKVKNKIKEYGEIWFLLEDSQFEGKPAFLAMVNSSGGYTRWFLKSEASFNHLTKERTRE